MKESPKERAMAVVTICMAIFEIVVLIMGVGWYLEGRDHCKESCNTKGFEFVKYKYSLKDQMFPTRLSDNECYCKVGKQELRIW